MRTHKTCKELHVLAIFAQHVVDCTPRSEEAVRGEEQYDRLEGVCPLSAEVRAGVGVMEC